MRLYIFIAFAILASTACQQKNGKSIEGHWQMQQVLMDGKDVSGDHNPNKDRFIIFDGEGGFESGGGSVGSNTGKYTYDPAADTLFLDSDAGAEDDSRWQVSFNGDTMHWQGFGRPWAKRFRIVQIRAKQEAVAPH